MAERFLARLRHYLWDHVSPFSSRRAHLRALWHGVVRGYEYEICRDCGRPVGLVWSAPHDLWNEIWGDEGGLLCPRCFDTRCERAGKFLRWTMEAL